MGDWQAIQERRCGKYLKPCRQGFTDDRVRVRSALVVTAHPETIRLAADEPPTARTTSVRVTIQELSDFALPYSVPSECYATTNFLEWDFGTIRIW